MMASFFLWINASDYVPSEGRAAWLEQHGPQVASVLVELTAAIGTWEACGYVIQTDGTLERRPGDSGVGRGETEVISYRRLQQQAYEFLREHLRAYGRQHGGMPPQPYDMTAELGGWLVSYRLAEEARNVEAEAKSQRERAERDAAEARRVAERASERAALLSARRALLEQHGDPEQIERLEAGVLPEAELMVTIAAGVLPRLALYRPITEEEVSAECEAGDCSVSITSLRARREQPGELSRDEWRSYRDILAELDAIAARTPGLDYVSEVQVQRGDCSDSEHGVMRLALEVNYRIAGLRLERLYGIGAVVTDRRYRLGLLGSSELSPEDYGTAEEAIQALEADDDRVVVYQERHPDGRWETVERPIER